MLKLVTAFLFLLVVTVNSSPLQSRSPINELYEIMVLEEPCVRQGGLCQRFENCDPGNIVTAHGGLCPKQMHLGVVCCYI